MSQEPEDYNAFNCWDSLGAVLMLTLTPALLNYVFNDQNITLSVVIIIVGVILSLLVCGLALFTHARVVSNIVNLLGGILTVVYVAVTVYYFVWYEKEPAQDNAAEAVAPNSAQ